jgi:hypothetical protein
MAAHEALVKADPQATAYRAGLAENYQNRGLALHALGDPAGASADIRRALAVYDALPSRTGEQWFRSACSHAALSGLAGHPGSNVSALEASTEADGSMALLRKAVGLGYRNRDAYRTEDALAALRSRPDFQALMMDLAMPADPFAP